MSTEYGEPGTRRWEKRVNQAWGDFIRNGFNPVNAGVIEWKRLDPIIAVLDRLGRELPGVHFMYFPGGTCRVLTGATRSTKRGYMLLEAGEWRYPCRPISLQCLSFSPEWTFFDLDLGTPPLPAKRTAPSQQQEKRTRVARKIGRTGSAQLTNKAPWEVEIDDSRLDGGRIVIFSTASPYCIGGIEGERSDSRHNWMSREQFRKYIEIAAEYHQIKAEIYLEKEVFC